MTIELGLVVGAVACLALALLTWGLSLFFARTWWHMAATGLRLAAAGLMAAALALWSMSQGGWTPLHAGHVALSLALTTLLVQLVLAWANRLIAGAPVIDFVTLLFALAGLFLSGNVAPPLSCIQNAASLYLQWLLFVLGCGGVMVAGCTTLTVLLRRTLDGRSDPGLPAVQTLHTVLRQALALAIVAIGGGLVAGMWWAWHALGALSGGIPGEPWLVGIWLVAGMSQLAWQLNRSSSRWALGLALVAGLMVPLGLLVSQDLGLLLGTWT
jgi:hypothetical protein